MRALGIDGMNVTMPHKSDVVKALDRLSPAAQALGSVNTIARQGDHLVGESTDGEGFVNALREDEGVDPAGKRFAVLGAGGAGRAVVRAVAEAGASEVVVIARRPERADRCAKLAGRAGRVGAVADVADVDVIVNATPIGMGEVVAIDRREALPLDPALLSSGQLVIDLVYEPLVTPLVAAARERGLTAVNGVGMLIHQAALAFRIWTGEDAPLAVMSAGALTALANRD
jgi:shikimate dehydrogenase